MRSGNRPALSGSSASCETLFHEVLGPVRADERTRTPEASQARGEAMGGTTPSDKQSPSGVRSLEWWVQQVVPPLVSVAIPLIGGLVIKLWTGNTHLAVDICLGILVLVSFALFLRFIRQPLRYYALVVSILSFITLLALVTSQPLPWSRSTSQANQIHDKPVLILVARFNGPTPNNYSVTQTILGNLRNQLRGYSDVGVEPLRQEITEEDDYVARVEGKRRKAAIVIWGRYIPSGGDTFLPRVPLALRSTLLYLNRRRSSLHWAQVCRERWRASPSKESTTLPFKVSSLTEWLTLHYLWRA